MRKNRILSIFLCIAVVFSMFSGIFTNTPTAKADGTSGRDSVGHFSGGNYKVASSVGFGLKFSLKKRSRVLALHSPRNKKVLMNTMYDEDIASAFLCVSFNADGDVAWGKDNSKFRMVCVNTQKQELEYDKSFSNLNADEFKDIFGFEAEKFKSVMKNSMSTAPASLKASSLAPIIDKNFSNQSDATATAKKRLYSKEGREKFYKAFVNELSKANANALEDDIGDMDDWVKDGVLVIEPYAIYNNLAKQGVVGITYLSACQFMGDNADTDYKKDFQSVFGGFSISGQAGGLTAVRSLGGFYNGHGRKDCNYHPAGSNGQNIIHASDCTDKGAKWERIYSPELRDSYSYKLGWGAFGIWKGGEVENKSAANLSIKVTYGSNGKLSVDKQSSMVSASKGFKGVSANISSMNSSVEQNKDGKYHGRQKLGDDNKKAHVLNLPSGQKKYYGDYKLTSYGSYYVKADEKTFKYSLFNAMSHGNSELSAAIPDNATASWANVSGSDYNCGRRMSGYSMGGMEDNPRETAKIFANWFGLSDSSVHAITGNRPNTVDDKGAKQAKIAYNAFALANNYGTCESIKYNSNGITKGITGELKDDSKSRFGFSVQYLYKGKNITSYISTAKLKYDENLNPSLTIGSNSSETYDIGDIGKFTTSNTRAYIIAVPNCNSNNGCLLKNNANGSSIWDKVRDKASKSKSVIQLSDVASIITSSTGKQASVQGSANGSRTISVGTDSDDGYSIYVLEIDLPKSVPISSVLNLQDYQINYVYPKSLMKESASLGEKVNSTTVVEEITASNEHVSKKSSTWTCGGGNTHNKYQDDYAIKLFHGSGTSGHTVDKSFRTNALLMYNTSLGAYNTFSSVNSGWNTTSNNNALRIDYAFNLSRGGLGDKRTISGLSEDSYKNEKDYAIDSLGMEYGNKPKTAEAGGTTIRDSWAKYCNRVGDIIKFKSEWVNGVANPVEAYTTTHTYTTGSGTNIKTNTCYYDDTRATDSRPIYLRLLSLPLYEVRNSITEKIFKYRTDTIGTGINKWDTDLSDGKKLGGSTLPLDENIKPVSGVNATIPKSDMKENERYRFIVIAKSNKTLSYYPEVGMRAYITSGDTLTAGGIYAKTILTMGEKIRKTDPSSMYILRVTQPNTGDQVKGSIYSDTTATGSNADDLSKKNGNKPVVYGGSDITLKAEGKFNINMYGYSLDLINKDYDASMKYTTASGDTAYEQYTKVVNNNSDVYSDWGNDSTNSKVELFKQYKDWTESVKNSLTADVTLKVTGDAGYKKLYNDFSTSLGKLQGGTSSEDGVYSIQIRLGKIDTTTDQYKGLIKQIAKDYNCNEAKAGEIFEKSDIYKTIIRSIEDVNDDFNEAQKVTDTNNRVRTDESDKAWYDEEVKTFVIRRYKTTGVTTPNIVLNDKIDYGMAPDSTKGKDSTYNAQQSEYKSHTGQWYLTLYFKDNHSNKSDTNLYLSEQSLFNPNKSRVSTSENYYKGGNVLINELYIAGADFLIPSSTTSDMVQ